MLSRRALLQSVLLALISASGRSGNDDRQERQSKSHDKTSIGWPAFKSAMTVLAEDFTSGAIQQEMIGARAIRLLQQLDISSEDFQHAIAGAYESGNAYWVWQRLLKQRTINGGMLTINHDQLVPLHDHPGATGMLRIVSGECEVWQFNEVRTIANRNEQVTEVNATVELQLVDHRRAKPGDMALLTPAQGNIHALRAVTATCNMLDFFIPPYKTGQRCWYQPLSANWFGKQTIACRKIPQYEFTAA